MTAKSVLLSSLCLTKASIEDEDAIPLDFWEFVYENDDLILWECDLVEHEIVDTGNIKLCISAFKSVPYRLLGESKIRSHGNWSVTYYWSWTMPQRQVWSEALGDFTSNLSNIFSNYIIKENCFDKDECKEIIETIISKARLDDCKKLKDERNPEFTDYLKNLLK